MATESDGKPLRGTGDPTTCNAPAAKGPGMKSVLIGAGGGGASTAGDTDGSEESPYCKGGHPVDIYGGDVIDEMVDLTLPGLIPVELKRFYNSVFSGESGPFGKGGWTFSLNQWIEEDDVGPKLRNDDGRFLRFAPPALGQAIFKRSKRLEITRVGSDAYRVVSVDTRMVREFSGGSSGSAQARSAGAAPASSRALLRRIVDRRGNHVDFHYTDERLSRIVDTAGRELHFLHDSAGRIVRAEIRVDGQLVQPVDYGYSDGGELAWARNALGYCDHYEYDGKHRMVKTTLKNGVSFYYAFDAFSDKCVKTWGDGGLYALEFIRESKDEQLTVTTIGADEPRIRTFNAQGDLLSERTFAGDFQETTEYDADHYVLSRTNAAGHATRYEYDARGNRTLLVDAAGNETRWEYSGDSLVRRTDPGGQVTRYQQDPFGALSSIVYPTGASYWLEYDNYGRISAILGPLGLIVRLVYDERHQTVEQMRARGDRWRYAFDLAGRPVTRTDPLGQVTQVEYDAIGQPIRIRYPDGSITERRYEPLGNVSEFTNPLGHVTTMRYVGTGCLSKQTTFDGQVWHFFYDTSERLVRIKNPKAELYEYRYDSVGRIVEERTFDARTIRYTYTLAGEIRRIEQPDGTYREFSYDSLGNILEEVSSHGSHTYIRDVLGLVQQAILDEGEKIVVSYERDDFGRVIREHQGSHTLEYAFDVQGNRVQRSVPACGVTDYHRDAAGDLTKLHHRAPSGAEQTLVLERDLLGREILRRNSDDLVHIEQRYDPMDRLLEQKIGPSASPGQQVQQLLTHRKWQYDLAGRAIQIDDRRWGPTQYEYDRLGQLTAARHGELHEVFEYQPNGSLQRGLNALVPNESSEGPGVWDIGQGNILLRTDKHVYEYDACNRRTAKVDRVSGERTEYVWDCRDRLREVRFSDQSKARYFYDALGRRVRKEVYPAPPPDFLDQLRQLGKKLDEQASEPLEPRSSTLRGTEQATTTGEDVDDPTRKPAEEGPGELEPLAEHALSPRITFFLWDGDELAAELDSQSGPRGHVHYPGTFVPLLQIERGEIFNVVADHLGTPKDLIGSDGTVRWSASYTAWGKIVEEFVADAQRPRGPPELHPDALRSPFRHRGQYWDEETGLAATKFRAWDPETGRWISPDPLGVLGGLNLSALNGSPTTTLDPYGLNNTDTGDAGEAAATRYLAAQRMPNDPQARRYEVLGPMQNGSGHGVDILARDRSTGDLVAIEVKANSSQLSEDQQRGPDWYARDRAQKAIDGEAQWASADKKALENAEIIKNYKGKIVGLKIRVTVDEDGTAKVKSVKPWCPN